LEFRNAAGRSANPDPAEIAAIVAVLESVEAHETPASPPPAPSRWRKAARSFDGERS
jgi:hypothetical protein